MTLHFDTHLGFHFEHDLKKHHRPVHMQVCVCANMRVFFAWYFWEKSVLILSYETLT